jgi:hypothetical protein
MGRGTSRLLTALALGLAVSGTAAAVDYQMVVTLDAG